MHESQREAIGHVFGAYTNNPPIFRDAKNALGRGTGKLRARPKFYGSFSHRTAGRVTLISNRRGMLGGDVFRYAAAIVFRS